MRALVVAVLLASACGRTGAVTSSKCVPYTAQEWNETGDCLGPPVDTEGLTLCHDPSEAQGHSSNPVCVVGATGRVFRGRISSTEWLEGAGWTHSATVTDASTLSTADEARCARALPATIPACQ